MKTKLRILVLTLFFSVVSSYSQNADVWDFGATQLDNTQFNNQLNETVINSWYASSVVPGSTGVNLPVAFTAGALSWVGGTSDRLRTTNTALSRFDANIASVTSNTGRIYCNATAAVSAGLPTTRYISMVLAEDDEVKIIARGDTAGSLSFVNAANPTLQTDTFATTATAGTVTEVNFVAKNAGTFRIFDAVAKASFYRIYRKAATYVTVSGNINLAQAAGIPSNYSLVFTNAAGKSWTTVINSGTYSVTIPVGYTYTLSLVNASGFIISSGETLNTTGITTPTSNHNVAISGVSLYTVTGTISGLGSSISNLSLTYVPAASSGSIYVPAPVINATNGTYSVQLEPNIAYAITANGVNDFNIASNTITIPSANTTSNITFTAKPVYNVTINTTGLNATQLSNLNLTFTNLNEAGYVYNFANTTSVALRNGTYAVTSSNLNNFPVQQALTSNLTVNNTAVSKAINYVPVTVWSFNDQVISTTTSAAYKGMLLNGQITTVVASGHLTAKTGSTIQVPVNPGEKVSVSYYFTANFSIEGGATVTTNTNSTSIVENVEYVYAGSSAGFVTITVGGAASLTTYFTEIKIGGSIPYDSVLTVGVDKDFQTINAALATVSNMIRTSTQRVTILIDPGNYEEMLVVNQPNVTLKNASANPNTNIINAGVDIAPNAVRITSYYGHGYNYYSMSNNQKWNQEVLNVNIANGYASYTNTGAGTTNGSYWNATVAVSANGFQADDIIFENSFNQYISNKESQDVLVLASGSPGVRPTNFGNTAVQNKSFVERAAAIAITNNTDKVILNKCRVVGRQDSFFGGSGARVAVYKGDMMGAVDYIFGGMDVVFYKSKLAMNTSDQSSDLCYITAAQQTTGRGYLMYECTITTAQPLVETASTFRSKPGYFGRPWQANTSEVVFYNTTIETSNYTGFVGNSLILPLGWLNTLGGTSSGMYEYGTIEQSGVNNTPVRATWATSLTNPILNDGSPITTLNFTQGTDGWDPFPQLISNDALGNSDFDATSSVNVIAYKNTINVSNVTSNTNVYVYNMLGSLVKSFETNSDATFTMNAGIWIVLVKAQDGLKSVKVITN